MYKINLLFLYMSTRDMVYVKYSDFDFRDKAQRFSNSIIRVFDIFTFP